MLRSTILIRYYLTGSYLGSKGYCSFGKVFWRWMDKVVGFIVRLRSCAVTGGFAYFKGVGNHVRILIGERQC